MWHVWRYYEVWSTGKHSLAVHSTGQRTHAARPHSSSVHTRYSALQAERVCARMSGISGFSQLGSRVVLYLMVLDGEVSRRAPRKHIAEALGLPGE